MVRMLCSASGTWPEMAATARRFSSWAASIRFCTCRVKAASSGRTGTSSSARPVFFPAITARMDRIRQASAAMEITPEVNSASTVSTSPENRAATAPGSCPARTEAGRAVSLADIRLRREWVIFWPRISSSVSCPTARSPSRARLAKYSATAEKAGSPPPVSLSIMRPSSRGGSREDSTEAAAHSSVARVRVLLAPAAPVTARTTPDLDLPMVFPSCLAFV